jgi:hypothetical protein
MNTTIEKAFAEWLASFSGFEGINIHPGQSDEEIPNDEAIVYIVCNSTNSPASSLYIASVQIVISTPEVIEGNIEVHKGIVESLRTAFRQAELLSSFFPSTIVCMGSVLNKWDDAQNDGRWTTAADITVGIVDRLAVI